MERLETKYPGNWSAASPIETVTDGSCTHDVIARFGGWVVSMAGDLIYTGTEDNSDFYPIWDSQLRCAGDNDDWVLHLSEKRWFSTECYEDFKRAYFVACKIAGAEPEKQIRAYSERKNHKSPTPVDRAERTLVLSNELLKTCTKWFKKNPSESEVSEMINASQFFMVEILRGCTNKERALIICDHYFKKAKEVITGLDKEDFFIKD